MIKGIMGTKGVVVGGGNTSVPYVSINPNNPMQGMLRIHGSDIQVFDGSNWVLIGSSYATVELDDVTHATIEWAKKKMREESDLDEMCRKYPGLAKARDSFETFKRLVEDDFKNTI